MSTGKGLVSKSYLTAIANAIRAKTGSMGTYMPSQMANAINGITTQGGQDNTVLNSILDRSISGNYVNDDLTLIGDYAFCYCKLTSATFTKVTKVGGSAFNDCSSLESISLPEVKEIEASVFGWCSSLKSISMPKIEVLSDDSSYWGIFSYASEMKTINIPSTIKSIGKNAFDGSSITTINIDKPADSISGAPWGATGATVNWTGAT